MSEMKEKAITKFLAEQLGWGISFDEIDQREFYYAKGKSVDVEDIPFEFYVDEFCPMNEIEHVWMVEEALSWEQKKAYMRKLMRSGEWYLLCEDEISLDELWVFIHASPRERAVAITKALATDAQLKNWG